MSLSPNDIRNYSFSTQMRGYEKEAVDSFMEQTAQSLELAKQENLRLTMEIDGLRAQVQSLKQFEDTIKNAAIDARRNADSTIASAKAEALQIIEKAKAGANEMSSGSATRIQEIESQLMKLELTRKSYLSKLKGMILSHLELVNEVSGNEAPVGAMKPMVPSTPPKPASLLAQAPVQKLRPPVRTTKSIETQGISIQAQAKKQPLREDQIEVTDSTDITRESIETVGSQPNKVVPTKIEEANAPDPIIGAAIFDTHTTPAEPLEGKITQDRVFGSSKMPLVDPELAEALERYHKGTQDRMRKGPTDTQKTKLPVGSKVMQPAQDDVPSGFISRALEGEFDKSTDRVRVAAKPKLESIDPNALNLDPPINEKPKPKSSTTPMNISDELDQVAARFDEEMTKADKN
ncbi:MAG: DivIVA domain-containing protein [candidate division Zixibacteria bacterium]|nr:DivIVA domain-containing protein [candidate division Zixibacteria bacterium]